MPFVIIILVILVISLILIKRRKKKSTLKKQSYESLIPKDSSYEMGKVSEIEPGNSTWKSNCQSIYLVHGTFVGNDPFDLIGFLESAFPNLKSTVISKIRNQTKNSQDFFIRDFGNFHQSISSTVRKYLQPKSRIEFFNWSSSNHHIARVNGAIELTLEIAKINNKKDHILLVGHSHAGQIFALISQFLNEPLIKTQIINAINIEKTKETEFENALKKLSSMSFDFITLGTPIRYSWSLSKDMRLVHFINHRGVIPQGGSLTGALFTKTGDYIQQWAVAGSDILSPNLNERKINSELDLILGTGANIEELRRNIKFKNRLHHQGHHFLVDFKDNSKIPNSLISMFGHGIYTREKSIDWILNKAITHLQSQSQ